MASAVPFKVKAVYEYASQESDDLSFPLGQIITVTEAIDGDWYEGEYTDITGIKKAGIFPNNFVERYEPEVPSRPTRPTRPAKEVASPPPPAREEPEDESEEEAATISPPVKAAEPVAPQPKKSLEAARPPPAATTETKKPPPVAPKSNAFKDRIAAFNQPAAAPVLPFVPGQRSQAGGFVKKAFVAPPPSKDSYVPPPPKQEVRKTYVREEDPEIKQRQEEDQLAAQNAGLIGEEQEGEDVPKPTSLKDRIALLQKQQLEQAQRRSDGGVKKEKKAPPPPPKQDEEDLEDEDETEVAEDIPATRTSIDSIPPQLPPAAPQKRPTNPPTPAIPQHEILSGGEEADQSAAGEETEEDTATIGADDSESVQRTISRQAPPTHESAPPVPEEEDGEETAEDEEVDEETRRRLELRERMAKMSGGMGMAGMFGPPGGLPPPAKKRSSTKERQSTEDSASSPPQAPIPVIPVEGLQRMRSPDTLPSKPDASEEHAVPAVPKDSSYNRPAPPLPPPESRASITAAQTARPTGLGLDQEAEPSAIVETPGAQTPLPIRGSAPPVPRSASIQENRSSYFDANTQQSRNPGSVGSPMTSPKPAPPARPTEQPPAIDAERGESEYEGDYDTDIGSSAKHKDALRAHTREPSNDDSTTADEASASPTITSNVPTPMSRAVPPPPPPTAAPTKSRQSTDLPRAPPPPVPAAADDGDYDPYRYADTYKAPTGATPSAVPPIPPRITQEEAESSDDAYTAPTRRSTDRPPPPPPPTEPLPPPQRASTRQSLDVQPQAFSRRSMEQSRPSGEHGQIAADIDLSEDTQWWTAPQAIPPILQSRVGVDILTESEESTTSKRGGKTTVNKDIYILYIDYSQTVITARYDSREPSDVVLEQRHEAPPAKLRQDQLEQFWTKIGQNVAETAAAVGNSKKESTIGDGSAVSMVHELIKARPEALLPVGTKAYGALVYANLANASVMQFDEIRPGDVLTLRNAKFEGKHSGPMHQKYKQELGPSHVALVHEWDGTKKKLRAWEQGRDKKSGLRSESYRLADLKSGEVRVWRVVGREWVGWDSNN